MSTTIQVSQATKQLLQQLKEKEHAPTYDHVIQHLAKKRAGITPSIFGSVRGLHWNKKDRLRLHEL